jgi:oxygen-independent coproporphyrinogen-3 oxidase
MAGVYISYPFCGQKCTYCNFASGVLPRELEPEYFEALRLEIERHQWDWRPETVYIGGGTPSRIEPELFEKLLAAVPGNPWTEATIEAAPGTITPENARAWRNAGINRASLGVQSFVAQELARTGRKHRAETVAADVRTLADAGIIQVNLDLIAGLPGQTRASWRESLDWIERLSPSHVSIYMLEVDDDSRLGRELLLGGVRYGASDVPGDELIVELYETGVDRLAAMGLSRYEISNFARPGFESRHNLKYWRLEPYVGFGSDAHSYSGAERWQNVESAGEYVERIRRGESPREETVAANRAQERFFVGLRLSDGIRPEPEEWRRFAQPIQRFVDAGLLNIDGEILRLTRRGVLFSNEVFQEFITA